MKAAILFVVLSFAASAQTDSIITFTSSQVRGIADRFRAKAFDLEVCREYSKQADTLTLKQSYQILDLEERLEAKEATIQTQRGQIELYEANETLHRSTEQALRQQIEATRPRWYESPYVWGTLGAVAGFLVSR